MATDYNIEKSIVFAGTLNQAQIKEVLLRSDIFLQPSIRAENGDEEGLPQATLESQVFGLPAIVTNTGGLPEVVTHNKNGFIVEQKNANNLAQAMLTLANDGDLRNKMGQYAYHSVREQFDSNKCNQRWNTFFGDAMKQL
jgi:glycosyltransferase involved in cell wall biosynthesis